METRRFSFKNKNPHVVWCTWYIVLRSSRWIDCRTRWRTKSKVVSLIVATPKEFVHQFNMARKIAGETSRSCHFVCYLRSFINFPKKAFENDDHNDFVVPESYYAHRTTRSVREIMDSYSFKGFDVKRSDVQTLSILSRGDSSIISSSCVSKAERERERRVRSTSFSSV